MSIFLGRRLLYAIEGRQGNVVHSTRQQQQQKKKQQQQQEAAGLRASFTPPSNDIIPAKILRLFKSCWRCRYNACAVAAVGSVWWLIEATCTFIFNILPLSRSPHALYFALRQLRLPFPRLIAWVSVDQKYCFFFPWNFPCVWQVDEHGRVAIHKLSIFSAGNRGGVDKTHPSDETTKKKNKRSKAPEMH